MAAAGTAVGEEVHHSPPLSLGISAVAAARAREPKPSRALCCWSFAGTGSGVIKE